MIHVFLGTKAQLIKMAPVMKLMQEQGIEYNFIFSGQHQETIKDLRENFGIKEPDCILHAGSDINSIPKMLFWTIKIITKTLINSKNIWKKDKQGIVLNHGDTFSTLLGSILAKISGQKNAHIESGLRSFNILHPFPEELTRLCVFRLTDIFFAPGDWAAKNLSKYNGKIINTHNNTLLDALNAQETTKRKLKVEIPEEKYAIVSLHRFENIASQKALTKVINNVKNIAKHVRCLFILHSPTKIRLEKTGLLDELQKNQNIELRPRYDYFTFIELVKGSEFVVTDGGSNQEECAYLGKPCLLLRKTTERQEGIGANALISEYSTERIQNFIENYQSFSLKAKTHHATPSEIIVNELTRRW
jgi:UDP-N-acetylglucosamine 2-epimerase (non-hydrolysing)